MELGHKLLSPISFGDVVCFPISGLGLVILKKQTGQQVKRIRIKEELVSAVHSKNKLLLLGKRWFYVLEMPSGKPLWKTLVKGGDYHEMIQPNSNSCVIRSADGKSSFIHFVDTQNRRIAWRRRIEEKVVKIGCCGGSVYVITKSNFMLEIDPKRGLIRNKYFYPSLVPTSVGFSHDTMYFADYTGRFVAIKPEARLVCN